MQISLQKGWTISWFLIDIFFMTYVKENFFVADKQGNCLLPMGILIWEHKRAGWKGCRGWQLSHSLFVAAFLIFL